MRKRLQALLGPTEAAQLVLGTFHATCARYLRRYGALIGLDNNFAIADADDCKKIMARLLKERKDELVAVRMSLKEGVVLSEISKAKAKGETPDGMAVRAAQDNVETSTLTVIAELYGEYEAALREAGSLDFDDLLLFGLRLFREQPGILESCTHILVDEFQDTNTTQYELMKCFAKAHGGVSVVGDPDQSIYGWRSAEIENLSKMTKDFKDVEAIYLEENYRSTGAILDASHSIVSQDKARIAKSLYTSHPKSTAVTLKMLATPVVEASFIATEIKRLVAFSGGVLNYDDFAILLRYNALSRVLESALQKEGIPNRIIGGHKFFERMEIKDLLAYLQLADNPNFTPAFMRVVNTPRRGMGDKSVADLVAAARKKRVPPMALCEDIIDGEKLPAGIKPSMKKNLASFVGVVRKLRRAALKGTPVDDLIRIAIEKLLYEEYLRSSQQDFDQRWENVQELINYSVIVSEEFDKQGEAEDGVAQAEGFVSAKKMPLVGDATSLSLDAAASLHPMFRDGERSSRSRSTSLVPKNNQRRSGRARVKVEDDIIEVLSSDEDLDEPSPQPTRATVVDGDTMTPLRFFLQKSMLSTDTEANEEDEKVPRVTISTVHAAKGLEWPVVFIPAVEQDTFPSYRCIEEHEIAEERRLLYVAMTRAQLFLTLTRSQYRMAGGEDKERQLSEFVAASIRDDPHVFTSTLPEVDGDIRKQIGQMLGRAAPDEETTKEMIMKHVRAAPPLSTWDVPAPGKKGYGMYGSRRETGVGRASDYWKSDADDYALPPMGSEASGGRVSFFSSAKSMAQWQAPAAPKPPVQRLESSNKNLPSGPLPFSFGGQHTARPDATLSSFASAGSSSLAAMKALGLPDDSPIGTTPGSGESSVPLARGTKRLGMGRPAPWGSKKAKQ
ncbi:hypothetical protein CcaverHIS002_0504070 [Cutaneotrichosporon cavernicola]|nr:hypothetical protein CcaverHIS002_0504070 [Cutaneotrichosporon cavernicola]BEJ00610.1 hypothetical protein CcaverHIS631_0504670 [Cutaneotrichosporon cavernicola]BEJ08377.1 hypothetical protein CcaverHIS641_0504620 [Cutaneotrichosporon cavernicola]